MTVGAPDCSEQASTSQFQCFTARSHSNPLITPSTLVEAATGPTEVWGEVFDISSQSQYICLVLCLLQVPSLIVYGDQDAQLGEASLRNLSKLSNHRVVVMRGAGHPCYLDDPDTWHRALTDFLLTLWKWHHERVPPDPNLKSRGAIVTPDSHLRLSNKWRLWLTVYTCI